MATPILNEISVDLSYKLQDPVASATANGTRVTAANRLSYITRAYRRFLRIVTMLYPTLITKLFQSYYNTATTTTSNTGTLTYDAAEIFEVFCKQPSDEEYNRAEAISPEDFLSVDAGYSALYEPDINTSAFYWSMMSGSVNILPRILYDVKISYRANVAKNVEAGGYNGATDIDIPKEFTDLLVSLAAAEGYMDLGQVDMIQVYRGDVKDQLDILAGIKKEKEIKDETKRPS